MERKRSSQSSTTTSDHAPLLASDGDNTVNIGIGLDTQDPEVKVGPSTSPDAGETSFSFRRLSREKKWTLVTMAFANFVACTCFSLLAPFFPAEAAKKGASQTVIGLIFSCFELWIFVSAPIYGNFLTRIGSRFMFISGLFVCGGCAILFGVLDKCPSGVTFMVMCFLVRTVEALGASAFITASFAIIANEFPAQVSTVFGALETFSGLGLMVGPPIGGALFELGGFGLPFWVMGGILMTCACLTALLMPSRPDSHRPNRGSMFLMLTSPLVLVTTVTIVSGSYSLGFLDPTLAGHLSQFNLRTVYVGLVFIIPATLYALTAPLWGYLSDSKGVSYPFIIIGNTVSVAAFLLIGPSPLLPFLKHELWLVILSLAIMGLSVGSALVCTLKCLFNGAKMVGFEDNLDTYGMVSGFFNSAFSFGTFIGPTVGSAIQDYKGFDWAATVTAAVFAVAAISFASYVILAKSCKACHPAQPAGTSAAKDDASQGLLRQASQVTYNSISSTPVISNSSSIAHDNT
ncbi:MFS-type transporter SLC18B1-like [Littorina saxatilis]|uniref:Major facilitator superfamily (MFS) profile domain-containing protein n=1 Tax=Littorina saxatilis TaxID=31220 RepID=A0AAN9AQ62_9CAEN